MIVDKKLSARRYNDVNSNFTADQTFEGNDLVI